MRPPIYGVLFLDPSRRSPLELVKSSGAQPVFGEGIILYGQRGTRLVNLQTVGWRLAPRTCSASPASAPFVARTQLSATACFQLEAAGRSARATQVVKE